MSLSRYCAIFLRRAPDSLSRVLAQAEDDDSALLSKPGAPAITTNVVSKPATETITYSMAAAGEHVSFKSVDAITIPDSMPVAVRAAVTAASLEAFAAGTLIAIEPIITATDSRAPAPDEQTHGIALRRVVSLQLRMRRAN